MIIGSRLRSAMSRARTCLAVVSGVERATFDRRLIAMIMHFTPLTGPIPVMSRTRGCSSGSCAPAEYDNSGNGVSSSRSGSTCSWASNFREGVAFDDCWSIRVEHAVRGGLEPCGGAEDRPAIEQGLLGHGLEASEQTVTGTSRSNREFVGQPLITGVGSSVAMSPHRTTGSAQASALLGGRCSDIGHVQSWQKHVSTVDHQLLT